MSTAFKAYQKPYAVLIGLDSMQGIQMARILSAKKVPVVAIAQKSNYYGCRTRCCEEILFGNTGSDQLIDMLMEIGPRFPEKPVLIPCQDQNVILACRHRDRLQQYYRLQQAPQEIVETFMDKVKFYKYAAENDLPIPKTYFISSLEEIRRASESVDYPCLLKPAVRSVAWERQTTQKAFKINTVEELLAVYREYSPLAGEMILQQWVEGNDECLISYNGYFTDDSQPIGSFISRKIRQWPPRTGQSSLSIECRNDFVLETALRLFKESKFRGMGYLEVKRDANTGEHYIIEPNIGRPTGRSAIAESGGVELHYAMYCDIAGLPLPAMQPQKYGKARWIHSIRDFRSALFYWREGELSLGQWLASLRGRKSYALFSWRDPLPFLYAMKLAVKVILSPGQQDSHAPAQQEMIAKTDSGATR